MRVATGIKKAKAAEQLHIYPNPNNGRFTISISSKKKKDYSIKIFDIQGIVVYNLYAKGIDRKDLIIDRNLPSGVYIVKVNEEPYKILIL